MLPELAAVVAVALALYAHTLGFDFSYLDDDALILDQQGFLAQPSGLWRAFGRPTFPASPASSPSSSPSSGRDHAYYRPLVTATYALDAQWTGARPLGYRLTNLVLHALAAGLLFVLLRRLGHRDGVALFGGLLFAVHPALTEAVAWIPGRNDSLVTVFALASWLLFLRAWETKRWPDRIGHLLFWLAALCTKEAAIVLPLVFLGHLALVERRPARTLAAPWLLAGWTVVLAIYLAARAAALPDGSGTAGVTAAGFFAHAPVILTSLGKLVLPVHLSVLATPEDSWLWPGLLGAGLLFAALILRGIQRASILFALVCFILLVAPSLPASNLIALESRLYLPAVAIVLAVCEIARRATGPTRVRVVAGGAIIAVLAAVSFSYSGDFRDRLAFSEAAVRGSPHSALAHRNLGVTYQLAGDPSRARGEYQRALAEDAGEPVVHNNLAVLLMAEGRLDEAESELRRELALNPGYAPAQQNLEAVLRARGESRAAARTAAPAPSAPP